MSWKTDIIFLGGLGVAAFVAISNIDKIGKWLGDLISSGAANAGQAALEGAANVAAVPGTALELLAYNLQIGQQAQFRELQSSLLDKVSSAISQGDTQTAQESYKASVEARISALEASPGGLSAQGKQVILEQQAETLCRVFGVCPGTSTTEDVQVMQAQTVQPQAFPNPVANIPGATPFPTAPVTSSSAPAQSAGYSAAQMEAAQAYVSQPGVTQQYVETFADPGSPAWIAAQNAGLV